MTATELAKATDAVREAWYAEEVSVSRHALATLLTVARSVWPLTHDLPEVQQRLLAEALVSAEHALDQR